jgi:hypothetical protein
VTAILAAKVADPPLAVSYVASSASSITVRINPSIENEGSPVQAYSLYIDAGEIESSFVQVGTYNITDPSFNPTIYVSGLTAGLTYRFVSTAWNEIGESKYSNEVRFAAASLPSQPQQLVRGVKSTQNQIHITWSIEPDTEVLITGY